MRAGPRTVLRAIRDRMARFSRLVEIAEIGYEPAPATCFVRRREVAAFVAERIGETVSNRLQIDLIAALKRAGWQTYQLDNRALWRGVKPRGLPEDQAIKASEAEVERMRAWAQGDSPP